MADYDDPRPSSQPVGSTDLAVAKDNLITFDRLLVAPAGTAVSNRKGEQLTPWIDLAGPGYQIVGDFADVTKVEITKNNQVYTSKGVAGLEDALWRTNQVLPYTPTGSDPTQAPEEGKWTAVAVGELTAIARSLNILDTQVIYSTDTTTPIVKYIYDATAEKTYSVPNKALGKIIDSVVGTTLTTTEPVVYTLIEVVGSDSELSSIARSLNVLDSQVIYSTDTVTVLGNVLYIYDTTAQVTWGKPAGVGAGETIVSVTDDQLETNITTYTLETIEKSSLNLTLAGAIASTEMKLGDSVTVSDRANGAFDAVLTSTVTPNETDIIQLDNTALSIQLRVNDKDIKLKQLGADGAAINDTAAFYRALELTGHLDLQGLELNVTVTATYAVVKKIRIKNGSINFSSSTALRVFTWISGDRLRLADVEITGNSNGTIDDSFDATSGTIALIRAELIVDEAAKNLQLERVKIKQMIAVEDNKNAVTSATAFRVKQGYIRNCEFEDIPGHAFASNCYVGIKITQCKFKNIGALCVDFGALTSSCIFEENEINVAAGIGKTQNRFNSGELMLPQNNSISFNDAKNLTSGNASNVAVLKGSGKSDKFERNVVIYEGGTAVESIEIFGSANVIDNDITRTLNKTRSYVTTASDSNLVGVLDNPVIAIIGNKGSGMLNFARLQNTNVARVTIERNRPDDVAKFINGEANLNLPSLSILDNDYDTSATVGVGIQFASSTVSLERLKVHGNTGKSEGTGLVAWVAEGASVTGNTFEHATGNNFDIINTNSYIVIGNGANAAWPVTVSEKIVENNTQFA